MSPFTFNWRFLPVCSQPAALGGRNRRDRGSSLLRRPQNTARRQTPPTAGRRGGKHNVFPVGTSGIIASKKETSWLVFQLRLQ